MFGEESADELTREVLREMIETERQEILKTDQYKIWKEWFRYVWLDPNSEEVQRREDEVDLEGLPFEYMKVYNK